jgi:hypothetical protein
MSTDKGSDEGETKRKALTRRAQRKARVTVVRFDDTGSG